MATILKLGPADHGQPLTYEEFEAAHYEDGYQYEIIEGKLYVAALPKAPQGLLELWIFRKLLAYSDRHPEVTNFIYNKTEVFVVPAAEVTAPQPDVAAFHNFPIDQPWAEIDWESQSPFLVVEVVSANDPWKDLVRNVRLYRQVPSIVEYWILDNRGNADEPSLRVHRRSGRRWRILDFAFGETYTTRMLPGFSLVIDPRR